jgi:3-hydroxybutyryl-CoA dehydratase
MKTIRIGQKFSKEFIVTKNMVNDFASCTGDLNPIHLDEEFAKNTRFKKPIAHGFLVGSFISSVLGNDFPGQGTIYISQRMNFNHPVYIEEKIIVDVEVNKILSRSKIFLKTKCLNKMGVKVIDGDASVLVPSGSLILP